MRFVHIIPGDRIEIVRGAAGNVGGDWKSLGRALGARSARERASSIGWSVPASPHDSAEVDNIQMQLAFLQAG